MRKRKRLPTFTFPVLFDGLVQPNMNGFESRLCACDEDFSLKLLASNYSGGPSPKHEARFFDASKCTEGIGAHAKSRIIIYVRSLSKITSGPWQCSLELVEVLRALVRGEIKTHNVCSEMRMRVRATLAQRHSRLHG